AEELRSAYEWLAHLRPAGEECYADYLRSLALRLPARQTLVCVTPLSGAALLASLRRLRSAGSMCKILLVHTEPALSWAHRQWKSELAGIGAGFAEVQAQAVRIACVEGGAVDGIA